MHRLAVLELAPGNTIVQMCTLILLRVGCIGGYLEFVVRNSNYLAKDVGKEYMYALCVPNNEHMIIGKYKGVKRDVLS